MKRNKGSTILLVVAMFVTVLSFEVSAAKPKKLFDCTGKIQKAIEKYNKKQFGTCNELLTEVLSQCPGHSAYDTALFYQGKSLMAIKKYADAKNEFERLITTYSNSGFYEEAYFRMGQSMFLGSNAVELDQATTKDAQAKLKDFCELFPKGVYIDSAKAALVLADDKLAEKEMLAARFYEKIDQFESAIVYYKLMIDKFPQSKHVAPALLSMAEDLVKTNRSGEAGVVLDEILAQPRDETIMKKAQGLKASLPKGQ